MLRSLFTGISGLSAHQEMLDVTANNIANVNTTGFKSSTVQFEDTLSQTMSGGGAGITGQAGPPVVNAVGGTNPQQVGLGVQVAGTTLNFTQGSNQQTGVKTNMLINGDGFFAVSTDGTNSMYTRNGAFTVDGVGHLVTPDGAMLEDATGKVIQLPLTTVNVGNTTPPTMGTWSDFSISQDGTITGIDATTKLPITDPTATNPPIKIGVVSFNNPNGLEKVGNSRYQQTAASGQPTEIAANLTTGYIEMSNVDLARELTNLIVSERGFQANSKVISTSDEVLQTLVNMT